MVAYENREALLSSDRACLKDDGPAINRRPARANTIHSAVILLLMMPGASLHAQDSPHAQDTASLAKAAQNPIADMISLPFQNNTNLNAGPESQTQNVLNIQPVFPFHIDPNWNLITRTIVPVISQPSFGVPNADRTNGIGDIQFSAFFSPRAPSEWTWGVGPIAQLPTATNDVLGQGKWCLGVTGVALHQAKGNPWLYGALLNNIWSVGGESDRPTVNQMLFQPFVNYNFPDHPGRYLTFSPIITADWEAKGEQWTVPLGLGIGQIFRIGKQPVNVQAHAYYNLVRPDLVGNWTIRLQLQLLFPK
jgi:hypothetical protein